MKKIPSLFCRNYETDHLVRNEIVDGTNWVMAGEGVATQKFDGMCCKIENNLLYKRFELKKGKIAPKDFISADIINNITGNTVGWLPVLDQPEDKYFIEAAKEYLANEKLEMNWTYELVGPKINRNLENYTTHTLIPHGYVIIEEKQYERSFEGIKNFLKSTNIEGIVWWRNIFDLNCDKVKIKGKDFGFKREK